MRLLALGAAAAALLGAGAVGASALIDLPQEARPAPQDPVGDALRPTAAAAPIPPQEPAPSGDPAPAAPVVITPPTPLPEIARAEVVVEDAPADEPDEGEEEETEEAVEKASEPPAAPGRRQRRRVAVVQAIDKITAETMRFEVEVGGRPVRFDKSLIFTARACEVSAADETEDDSVAYLEVTLQPRAPGAEPRQIFRGWMFASAPAVSGLQHPIYDAWVVGCKA